MNAFWQLGSVTVPLVVGIVYSATGSFLAAFATLAVGPLIGAVIAFFIQEPATAGPLQRSPQPPDREPDPPNRQRPV